MWQPNKNDSHSLRHLIFRGDECLILHFLGLRHRNRWYSLSGESREREYQEMRSESVKMLSAKFDDLIQALAVYWQNLRNERGRVWSSLVPWKLLSNYPLSHVSSKSCSDVVVYLARARLTNALRGKDGLVLHKKPPIA